MINLADKKKDGSPMRFRLLNSEIGNDPDTSVDEGYHEVGFRLLNSEIGNDQEDEEE